MAKPRIGFASPGLMGHGAAKHILEKGWPLQILGHRNRAPVEDLLARGANEAISVAALGAGSDIVFLSLPGPEVVEDVLLHQGLLESLRPGTIVVDMTTSLPGLTRRLGARLAERGCGMVDAPVGRTPKEAEEGRLSSLLGGAPEHVAAVRPVIEAYADTIIEAGALGDAVTIKLINNVISFSNAMIIGESMAAAAKLGVNLEALCTMVEAGGANSVMFQWIAPWIRSGDDSRGRGRLDGAAGVLDSFRTIAAEAGAPSRIADTVSALTRDILAGGHGARFIPALPGILAAMAGATIRPLD